MEQRKDDYSRDIKALRDRITLYHRQERRFQCDDIGKNAGRVHPARIGVILLDRCNRRRPSYREFLRHLLDSVINYSRCSNSA